MSSFSLLYSRFFTHVCSLGPGWNVTTTPDGRGENQDDNRDTIGFDLSIIVEVLAPSRAYKKSSNLSHRF